MTIAELVERQRVLICCGTGGVGKTTTAAVLALEGARRGRRAVVVTIDPAKRLADALGLESLADTPSEIARERWDTANEAPAAGALSALMLDTKSTFDSIVRRDAADDEQAQRILDNRFYRNVSGALGGTQEYMAMEKLHELHDSGDYDLIVVDTPPTRHALDFLDAPNRLLKLLDNRIFRLLILPTRASLRAASYAAQAFLRTVARVVGSEVIEDVIAFFQAFEGMEEGFRTRAAAVRALLADPTTGFVLITAPRRDAVEEARFFAQQLADHNQTTEALIVNRVHPAFGDEIPAGLRARSEELSKSTDDERTTADKLAVLYDNLADFREVAIRERSYLEGVHTQIAAGTLALVPYLAHDVFDFDALTEIGRYLFADNTTDR